MERMITVERALSLIKEQVVPLAAKKMDLGEVSGCVLAEDIKASKDIPSFPQSNMDGYAFAFKEGVIEYELVGEVAAGSNQKITLQKGTAVRIFTGAVVPEGADTVLMQEKAKVVAGNLFVLDEQLKQGNNVRAVGTEISKGAIAITKGTLLKPAAIGLLASMGIDQVLVYPKPKVGILVTGNELQKIGMPLEYGQVYESNSPSLLAALNELHIDIVQVRHAQDQLEQLTEELKSLMDASDLVLVTGGVSVGDYDFTTKAFEHCGIETIFHKIKQKPGKPLLFGKKANKLVFGLPGNPASVLNCFYEYLFPALGLMMGQNFSLKPLQVPIKHDFKKPAGLTHFLKAFYDGTNATVLTGQESYKLASYAAANCLAVFPEEVEQAAAGTIINIHLLP